MNLVKKWRIFQNQYLLKRLFIIGCVVGIVIILNQDERVKDSLTLKLSLNRINEPVWLEFMSLKMESRKKRLEENCRLTKLNIRGNDSLHKPNEWEFFVNRRYRMVWCNVFKAASTSWIYNFNILAGYSELYLEKSKQVPLQLARKKYPRPTLDTLEAALNDSTSFIIVRHPFERLLSAYRDKIEHGILNSHYFKLGNYILLKHRYRLKEMVNRSCIMKEIKKQRNRPTFSEFVEYLINNHLTGKHMDEHWAPITNFCTPCQVRFDVIMKFETLQDDQNYLIKILNLENKIKPQWRNPTKDKIKIVNVIDKYYKQLSSIQIHKLYQIYRYDFYLFEYNLEQYSKYLNPEHVKMILNDFRKFF